MSMFLSWSLLSSIRCLNLYGAIRKTVVNSCDMGSVMPLRHILVEMHNSFTYYATWSILTEFILVVLLYSVIQGVAMQDI